MNLSIRNVSRRRVAVASATSSLALMFMLTACGSSETSESAGESSSTKASATISSSATSTASQPDSDAASASLSASSTASSNEEANGLAEENEGSAEAEVSENFVGAESLEKAETVSLDQKEVSETQDLYGKFEDAVSSAQTVETTVEGAEESATEEDAATAKTTTLDAGTSEKISAVATGSAADEFLATALEFSTNGWKQEGKSKIVGEPKVADTTYQGKSAKILEVCLDSSEVSVKDSAGNVLTSDSTPKRSLNIFTLIEENGSWKIAAHDFPNNPDC